MSKTHNNSLGDYAVDQEINLKNQKRQFTKYKPIYLPYYYLQRESHEQETKQVCTFWLKSCFYRTEF